MANVIKDTKYSTIMLQILAQVWGERLLDLASALQLKNRRRLLTSKSVIEQKSQLQNRLEVRSVITLLSKKETPNTLPIS